jgi:hypothetical protein
MNRSRSKKLATSFSSFFLGAFDTSLGVFFSTTAARELLETEISFCTVQVAINGRLLHLQCAAKSESVKKFVKISECEDSVVVERLETQVEGGKSSSSLQKLLHVI